MEKISNLIAATARKGTGKDYLCQCLINAGVCGRFGNIVRLSFSDELRILAHDLFPWCPLDPSYEEKDQVIDHPDNILGLTPRGVWLRLADNNDPSLRKVDPKLLINRFVNRHKDAIIGSPNTLFFVTDLRTYQEDDWLEDVGALKIRILEPNRTRDDEDSFEDATDKFRVDAEWIHHKQGDGGFTRFVEELLAC